MGWKFWEVDIHALLILGDDNPVHLGTQAKIVDNEINEFAKVIHVEVGKVFRRNDSKAIEHLAL